MGKDEFTLSELTRVALERAFQRSSDAQLKQPSKSNQVPKLGQLLVSQGLITSKDLATGLSQQLGVSYVDLNTYQFQPEALKLITESLAKKCNAIPLSINKGSLTIAMADPNDIYAVQALSAQAKMNIVSVIATPEDIHVAITLNYNSNIEIENQFADTFESTTAAEEVVDSSITNAPAVRALDLILEDAINNRASDIHIEPNENRVVVRNRIDGVLHEIVSLPSIAHSSLISRLKVLSNMDIGDHRPQDGHFAFKLKDKEVDVRVATIKTAYGEMGTLRILDKSFAIRQLSEIGFLSENLSQYEDILRSPFGMVLVSGPTGSGKTTTLYASINSLDRKGRNIVTIEDPIEYHLDGVNQIQVNPRAKLTFGNGLRSIMRHDPDVILVGEIRDTDTAKIAVQAANTGHLLLASIHANDTVGVLFRLVDLGIEPFLVASALVGIIAQRMLRRVCTHCQHKVSVSAAEEQAYYKEMREERKTFVYGVGCNRCSGTGYLGRLAVFEILRLSHEIRRLVSSGASSAEIRAKALEEGMVSMQRDGMAKVKAGVATPSDVLKNIFSLG